MQFWSIVFRSVFFQFLLLKYPVFWFWFLLQLLVFSLSICFSLFGDEKTIFFFGSSYLFALVSSLFISLWAVY